MKINLKFRFAFFSIILTLLACIVEGTAGIPEPPMILFGEIQNQDGNPASAGKLTVQISNSQGSEIFTVQADVDVEAEQTSFLARIPVESQVIDSIKNALTLGQQCLINFTYNGNTLESSELQSPVLVDRGKIIGPLNLQIGETVGNPPSFISILPENPIIQVGEAVQLTLVAQDLDGDTLNFMADPLDNLSIISFGQTGTTATLIVEFMGTEQNRGDNPIQFIVSDGHSQDSRTIHIIVGESSTTLHPELVYEFDQSTLLDDGWAEIPGGFISAPPASQSPLQFDFDPSLITTSTDKKGLAIYAQDSQVSFFYALQAIQTEVPVLLRMTVRANTPYTQIALVALQGDAAQGTIDGSIATHILATSSLEMGEERQILLLYEPFSMTTLTPAFQVAAVAGAPMTTVLIDRFEIYKIQPDSSVPAELLDFVSDNGNSSPSPAPGSDTPTFVYEWDQNSLLDCGWLEIPGGFVEAEAGYVLPVSLLNNQIPSSTDKKGLAFLNRSGEVNFIYTAQPFDTQGHPVLLRAVVQSDNPDAQFALVALKGDLTSGVDVDSSIATNIPISLQSMVDRETKLLLLYQPDSGNWITPALQVAGTGESKQVKFMVDRMEIFRLDPSYSYPGTLFQSKTE